MMAGMQRVLTVELQGELPQAKLDDLRGRLELRELGRLGDPDDAEFGYRYLRRDRGNRVSLSLWRRDDRHWAVHLSAEREPPDERTVRRCRVEILDAAAALGLSADRT